MAKVILKIRGLAQHESSIQLSRVPVQNEKMIIESRVYKVIDIYFTPDTNQDAVLIVERMNSGTSLFE